MKDQFWREETSFKKEDFCNCLFECANQKVKAGDFISKDLNQDFRERKLSIEKLDGIVGSR